MIATRTKDYKSFEIENVKFEAKIRGSRMYLRSIRPGDYADYHCAFMDAEDGSWKVYLHGSFQIALGSKWDKLSPEQIAVELLVLDKRKEITPLSQEERFNYLALS